MIKTFICRTEFTPRKLRWDFLYGCTMYKGWLPSLFFMAPIVVNIGAVDAPNNACKVKASALGVMKIQGFFNTNFEFCFGHRNHFSWFALCVPLSSFSAAFTPVWCQPCSISFICSAPLPLWKGFTFCIEFVKYRYWRLCGWEKCFSCRRGFGGVSCRNKVASWRSEAQMAWTLIIFTAQYSDSWEKTIYNDYLRFLHPLHAQLCRD